MTQNRKFGKGRKDPNIPHTHKKNYDNISGFKSGHVFPLFKKNIGFC